MEMTMMIAVLILQIVLTVAVLALRVKPQERRETVVNDGIRGYIISCIRDTKRWDHWKETDPDLDGEPPILENLSNSDLMDAYDYYCCGL